MCTTVKSAVEAIFGAKNQSGASMILRAISAKFLKPRECDDGKARINQFSGEIAAPLFSDTLPRRARASSLKIASLYPRPISAILFFLLSSDLCVSGPPVFQG